MGGQFFKGYDRLVWCVIVVNAAGGMIVGMVRSRPASPSDHRSNGEQEYSLKDREREERSTAVKDGQKRQATKGAKAPRQTHLLTRLVCVCCSGDEVCGQHSEGFRDGDLDAALHALLRRPLRATPALPLPLPCLLP